MTPDPSSAAGRLSESCAVGVSLSVSTGLLGDPGDGVQGLGGVSPGSEARWRGRGRGLSPSWHPVRGTGRCISGGGPAASARLCRLCRSVCRAEPLAAGHGAPPLSLRSPRRRDRCQTKHAPEHTPTSPHPLQAGTEHQVMDDRSHATRTVTQKHVTAGI